MQARIDVVNRVLREQITGIRVVRAFVREPLETRRFADANAELTDTALRAGRLMALMFPTVMLVLNASSVAVLWFGAHRVEQRRHRDRRADRVPQLPDADPVLGDDGDLHGGDGAAGGGQRRPDHRGAGHRVLGRCRPASRSHRPAGPARSSSTRCEFSYPGAERAGAARHQPAGQAGHHDGDHRIDRRRQDHAAVADSAVVRRHRRARSSSTASTSATIDPETLWDRIGLVPQKPFLFTGTVASNLRYGNPDATDEELWTALTIAQAKDFVAAMPEGLDAPIAQGGSNVSGGQRQRLAIARALVARAEHLPVRRLVLGARPGHRRPAARRAATR